MPEAVALARADAEATLVSRGVNPKAVQEFLGHATIGMTFDQYGHLMPGRRDEARVRMDAYLAQAADEGDPASGTAAGGPNPGPTAVPQEPESP